MRLTFCGGARTVTGSSFLLEAGGKKILIDCGLFQGSKTLRMRNAMELPYNPREIDYIILTHAHIDHSGLVPRLVKEGFQGKILATPATKSLAEIMLPDSGYIQVMEAEWQTRKNKRAGRPAAEPLYTVEEAEKALQYFLTVPYYQPYIFSPEMELKFYDAGHILGSVITEITVNEGGITEKLVFSGDLGKSNQPIIRDPDAVEEADYLIIEGTYGTRQHELENEKMNILQKLICDTVSRRGNIIVPAFAVGRTQELLYYLSLLMRDNKIPNIPIYIDSPLAISATEIYSRHPECYDAGMRELLLKGQDPFRFPEVIFSRSAEESQQINKLPGGAMIIAASGMAEAGRIKHHLKHNLWREESTILFVGYQAEGTLGRRILDGAKRVSIFGDEIRVRANIVSIDGFSAHADRLELIQWLGKFTKKPRMVILVHGEEEVLNRFSAELQSSYSYNTHIPNYLETLVFKPADTEQTIETQAWLRQKGSVLLNEWQELAARYTEQLELALADENAGERLLELEKGMAAVKGSLEKYGL